MSCEKKVKDSVKLLIIFTRHLLIIEGDGHPVPLGAPGYEAHPEHGAPRGLHPCRDVVPGLGAHQDLQVTLASLRGVHCYERVIISDTCGGHEDIG